MSATLDKDLNEALAELRAAGLYKEERTLSTPQSARVGTGGREVLNFCSNNYLGLADHPDLVAAAHEALDTWGFGLASVRFICGTQAPHLELERELATFLGTEDAILFSSCFDANGGVFEALFDARDAVVSDELNHASLIDGIRLCKAARHRYRNCDMADLEARLTEAAGARRRVVVTDGVFSMDGRIAPLADICDLADRHDALVLVDDSHATGFVGANGRGTPEAAGVGERVDILTGTFGKALGGASGGYVAASRAVVSTLRQRARPYLFSNTLAPAVVAGNRAALRLVATSDGARDRLWANTAAFRSAMTAHGFELAGADHPIVPVMFGDAARAAAAARAMLEAGIYVVAFSYPVVPRGAARIRVQLSAAHTAADVEACVRAFVAVRDRA